MKRKRPRQETSGFTTVQLVPPAGQNQDTPGRLLFYPENQSLPPHPLAEIH